MIWFSSSFQRGGYLSWQNANFAAKALLSDITFRTPKEKQTGPGSQISEK